MSSDKAKVFGISGRYALALFDLANESGALEAAEADLSKLSSMLDESVDLRSLVGSPVYGRADQAAAIEAVANAAKLSDLTIRFLGVVAANRRLSILKDMIVDFGKLLSHHRGEATAQVTSAHNLTGKQLEELKRKLKVSIGRDVTIDANVDESLLGGLVVKVGSLMVDSSLKTKLDNLAIAMKGVG